jgi:hypothetical protein
MVFHNNPKPCFSPTFSVTCIQKNVFANFHVSYLSTTCTSKIRSHHTQPPISNPPISRLTRLVKPSLVNSPKHENKLHGFLQGLLPCPQNRSKTTRPGRIQIEIVLSSPKNTENIRRKVKQEKAESQQILLRWGQDTYEDEQFGKKLYHHFFKLREKVGLLWPWKRRHLYIL